MMDSEQRYAAIVAALTVLPGVEQSMKRGFAQFGLKVGGKLFATPMKRGTLLLKMPRSRVDWLCDAGDGERLDIGNGRAMKEWIAVSPNAAVDWLDLAKEAMAFVRDSAEKD